MGMMDIRRAIFNKPTSLPAPVEITGATGFGYTASKNTKPIKCESTFKPSQDLHGAEYPYPAGAGKNMLKPNVNLPVEQNGVKITMEDGMYVLNGKCTSTFTFQLDNVAPDYIQYPCAPNESFGMTWISKGSNVPWNLEMYVGIKYDHQGITPGTRMYFNNSFSTAYITVDEEVTCYWTDCTLRIPQNCNLENTRVGLLMYNGSGTAPTAWQPYENICPISGWTGSSVSYQGNNLINIAADNEAVVNRSPENFTYEYDGNDVIVTPAGGGIIWSDQLIIWDGFLVTSDMVGQQYIVTGSSTKLSMVKTSNGQTWTAYVDDLAARNTAYTIKQADVGHRIGVELTCDFWQETRVSGIMLQHGSVATSYIPYSTPTTVDTEFPCVSNNQWDEEWEKGNINAQGEDTVDNTTIRCKGYIKAQEQTQYYIVAPKAGYVFFYDESHEFISSVGFAQNVGFTTPQNTAYIRFRMGTAYGTTYNHDIAINLPSTVTTYNPYSTTVYAGLIDPNKGVLRATWGKRVLNGAETWNSASSGQGYWTVEDSLVRSSNYTDLMKCNRLKTHIHNSNSYYINATDGITGWAGGGYQGQNWIYVKVEGITGTQELKAWLRDNPLEVVFELATPIEYPLTPQQIAIAKGSNWMWATIKNGELEAAPETFTLKARYITPTGE